MATSQARVNKKVHLVSYAVREPKVENFKIVEEAVGNVPDGKFLVKVLYFSQDPYMRGLMTKGDPTKPRAHGALPLDTAMTGAAVGQVVESKNENWKKGTLVHGFFGWNSYVISDGKGAYPIDDTHVPASAFLGILGLTGFTAWGGLMLVGKLTKGTVVVSAGAGATGSAVGQIAKIHGCRVVGIAGSDEKVKWMTEVAGFDVGINYKTEDIAAALAEKAPEGVDYYFDNVGGKTLEILIDKMNRHGVIMLCGAISQYNKPAEERYGIKNTSTAIGKELRIQGFMIPTYFKDHLGTFIKQASTWVAEGKLKYQETVIEGIENAPTAFQNLFQGKKTGKLVVHVGDKE